MRVPGGWLYRFEHQAEGISDTIVFVPSATAGADWGEDIGEETGE
jgi:hypothetical protein